MNDVVAVIAIVVAATTGTCWIDGTPEGRR